MRLEYETHRDGEIKERMIEEIALAIVGFSVSFSGGKVSKEEIVGTGLGIVFVAIVLILVGYFGSEQWVALRHFIEIMCFGYLPMRVLSWIG